MSDPRLANAAVRAADALDRIADALERIATTGEPHDGVEVEVRAGTTGEYPTRPINGQRVHWIGPTRPSTQIMPGDRWTPTMAARETK